MMSDVFVIGAGCSVPYGFPTGAMLMQKLKDLALFPQMVVDKFKMT